MNDLFSLGINCLQEKSVACLSLFLSKSLGTAIVISSSIVKVKKSLY